MSIMTDRDEEWRKGLAEATKKHNKRVAMFREVFNQSMRQFRKALDKKEEN